MDYRNYKEHTRILATLNIGLSVLYFLSFVALYSILHTNSKNIYYLQTTDGFIFKIEPFEAGNRHSDLVVFFE